MKINTDGIHHVSLRVKMWRAGCVGATRRRIQERAQSRSALLTRAGATA